MNEKRLYGLPRNPISLRRDIAFAHSDLEWLLACRTVTNRNDRVGQSGSQEILFQSG